MWVWVIGVQLQSDIELGHVNNHQLDLILSTSYICRFQQPSMTLHTLAISIEIFVNEGRKNVY